MKFLIVAGARPNFMKVAPVLRAFRAAGFNEPGRTVLLVHTGQHYDARMSDDFFRDLGIPAPDINLNVGSGSHAQQTAAVMLAFEPVCVAEKPDWVVVVGDVNSTVACALTARKLHLRVAHIEAGLRSRDMSMPEEINRLCTDAISDLLFTTDEGAGENLRHEGVSSERICFVGNTMIDTLLANLQRARSVAPLNGFRPRQFAVLTLHRPSNVDHEPTLRAILGAIGEIASHLPVVFPAHPRTIQRLSDFGLLETVRATPGLKIIEPLSYLPFVGLVAQSRMVLTDSGGIQEETTVLGVPCLTMRENTERPITCEIGTNRLVGVDPARVLAAAREILDGRMTPSRIPEKWDGKAAERIVAALVGRA
jgi:UDP-N-acetylglucosamine 2-epimerase (non-hydrolysing)